MPVIWFQVDPKKMPVGELKPNVMSSSKAATLAAAVYSSVVIMTSSLILVALLSTVISSSSVASMLNIRKLSIIPEGSLGEIRRSKALSFK